MRSYIDRFRYTRKLCQMEVPVLHRDVVHCSMILACLGREISWKLEAHVNFSPWLSYEVQPGMYPLVYSSMVRLRRRSIIRPLPRRGSKMTDMDRWTPGNRSGVQPYICSYLMKNGRSSSETKFLAQRK
jgi:hypothetical protein